MENTNNNNNVIDKIRRLLLNYDLTVGYALGEIKIRQEIMDLYRGDNRKPSQKKFVQAKIDIERYEIYVEEIVKAKKELENNLMFVLNRYTPKYKDIFWWACIEQRNYAEIEELTDYSYPTIKQIVRKVKEDIIGYFVDGDLKPIETKKRGRKKKALN